MHQDKSLVVGKGRHDACVVPRAVPMVKAMTALFSPMYLLNKIQNFKDEKACFTLEDNYWNGLGVIYGLLASKMGMVDFTNDWIKP